jgi:hypothetical protein
MGGWIIFSLTVIMLVLILTIGCLAYNERESIVQSWCETRKHISDNKKEIELRRLEVLEKTPELRQLIFHPKMIEKEENSSN